MIPGGSGEGGRHHSLGCTYRGNYFRIFRFQWDMGIFRRHRSLCTRGDVIFISGFGIRHEGGVAYDTADIGMQWQGSDFWISYFWILGIHATGWGWGCLWYRWRGTEGIIHWGALSGEVMLLEGGGSVIHCLSFLIYVAGHIIWWCSIHISFHP